jgi:hypothetical protein
MSPGESEVAEVIGRPAPPPPPRAPLGCASGSWDGWAGGPQPFNPGGLELGLLMGCFLHHLRPLFLRPLGRRLIKQSGALPYTESQEWGHIRDPGIGESEKKMAYT